MVFPTGVGMNRMWKDLMRVFAGVPHGRGDEPAGVTTKAYEF